MFHRCLGEWHSFLRDEIAEERLSLAVFTPNNHYLAHIGHISRKNGCLRAYSARAMERNIGRYSKLIKSRVLTGKNAGNIVERLATRSVVNISINIPSVLDIVEPKKTSLDDFEELPLTSKYNLGHQLWSPFSKADLSTCTSVESIPSTTILKELRKFYSRSASGTLRNTAIEISARALIISHVYGSLMYRRLRREYRRGNQFVLFHASNDS